MQLELRPSNAHRWLTCHGQPRAVAEITAKERSSKHADRGTVAHALLELALRLDLNEEQLMRYEGKTLKGVPQIEIDDVILRGIGHVVDYLRSYCALHPSATYHIEESLQIVLKDHTLQGTPDIVIDNLPHEVVILDYKNGVVYVGHEDNPQLLLYLIGYMQKEHMRATARTKYKLTIVQPNARAGIGPVREHPVDPTALRTFHGVAAKAVIAVHKPDAPRVAGEHCRFCRAAGLCSTYAEYVLREAGLEFSNVELRQMPSPENMTLEQLANVLRAMERLRAWLVSVEEIAIEQTLAGETVPGFKVVCSTPRRKWSNEQRVMQLMQRMGLDPEKFAPRSPLTPAQLEKLLRGPDEPKLLEFRRLITTNPVEPRIAPLDDTRKPYVPGTEFIEE